MPLYIFDLLSAKICVIFHAECMAGTVQMNGTHHCTVTKRPQLLTIDTLQTGYFYIQVLSLDK
jgi:hypothetical protein